MLLLFWLCASLLASYATYVWAVASFSWVAAKRRGFAAGLVGLCVVPPPLAWAMMHAHVSSNFTGAIEGWLSIVMMVLLISAGPIALIHGLSRKVFPSSAFEAADPFDERGKTMNRRQIAEAAAGTAVFAASGSMIGWGMIRGRHAFGLTETPVRVAGLPRVLDGYVITQVSDLHAGAFVGERELDEGFELVKKTRPDLIVVTGDLVDTDFGAARAVAAKLRTTTPRDGWVACLGNHDYYAGAWRVTSILRAAGIDVLVNQARRLRERDGGGFALLGVDDRSAPRYGGAGPRLDRALANVSPDVARVLLSHQPTTVDQWPGQVALQLSGHTHGGQINPGSRTVNVFFKYLAGPYAVGGTTLYVNRGFGTVGPPTRVGAPPEVSRLVLVAD
jgi:predicted MPP superfamily phosphohydrolase